MEINKRVYAGSLPICPMLSYLTVYPLSRNSWTTGPAKNSSLPSRYTEMVCPAARSFCSSCKHFATRDLSRLAPVDCFTCSKRSEVKGISSFSDCFNIFSLFDIQQRFNPDSKSDGFPIGNPTSDPDRVSDHKK